MAEAAQKKNNLQKDRKLTALVAGGAGFIGSHLCNTLISQNFNVICVDNLSTGKKDNLRDILTSANFTFIEADINNQNFTLPDELEIDYCFHLAGVEEHDKDLSLDTLLVNSLGTRQLLELSRKKQSKFILISAADLYGGVISNNSLKHYFGTSANSEAVLPVHEAKRFAEALSFEYYKKFDLDVRIIRVKDVYGPKMNFDRQDELAKLLKSAADKEKLEVSGDGLRTINPTYISDVVFGVVKAAIGEFTGEIFTLVNPDKVTIDSFAQTLKLVAGPLEIEHKKASEKMEIPASHLDLENTKEKLSWTPKVSLTEGVGSVIQSIRMGDIKLDVLSEEKFETLEINPVNEEVKEKVSTPVQKRSKTIFVRLAIFMLSLSLITVAVIYPSVAFAFNSYQGKQDLEESILMYYQESNEASVKTAFSAQNNFQSAAKNLQNIAWLAKMLGLREHLSNSDHLLDASENLAESVRYSARASQALISSSEKTNLTDEQALKILNDAVDHLFSSQEALEQTILVMDSISWDKTSDKILPSKEFMQRESSKLQNETDSLIEAINNNLE